jgi:hypothetical protein
LRHHAFAALMVLALGGCAQVIERGKLPDAVQHVGSPAVDRCRAQPDRDRRAACEQARDQALAFVEKLAVGDQVCLEGNSLLDGVTHRCKVRASVADASSHSVKLEIRESPPSSKYRQMDDYWFTEEALADVYVKSVGFAAPAAP